MEFDEVETGQEFETAARTVTEADIVNFAGVSGDFYYPHTNEEKMKSTPYGGRIAHGALVFSIATGLLWQSNENPLEVVALYGIDGMRFTEPVYPGDTVSVEVEVIDKEEKETAYGSGVVTVACNVVNQDDGTVLVFEMKTLVV